MDKTNLPPAGRLEIFSDGVFAIIMTLLILEIHVPSVKDVTNGIVLSTLKPLIPKFISFTISFFTLAIFWVNHHHFYNHVRHIDWKLLWMNIIFLFFLCIIPFTTAFIGDHTESGIVIAMYALNMYLASASFTLMGYYAFIRARLHDSDLSKDQINRELRKGISGSTTYLMILGVAFILRPLALFLLFLLPLIYVVPTFFTVSGKDH
jgi:uncharacterized membrane protein